ncbi:MAG: carboxypeptidase-like regulatory domain-containing protein [Actinobacteria bacterium]|nr:carboxypeptidase-like regulatory domain-containing protein [Actinomycetota bacterium]
MHRRRRSPANLLAAAAVAGLVAGTACLSGNEFEPLVPPTTSSTLPTNTTVAVDYSTVPLAAVPGTTTTAPVVVGPGPATLAGRVDGPDGPVAGAVVRAERLVGDEVASVDVVAGEDGTWTVAGVLGGRYRVRAWRQPDLATVEPQLLFVGAGGTDGVVVTVERFPPLVIDTAVAPDPPTVGERTSLRVRVATQEVDGEGVVVAVPRPAVPVSVQPGTGWALEPPPAAVTDEAGNVTFVLVCRMPGPQMLTVTLGSGEVLPITPPDCQPPAPPETAVPGDTTVPGGPGPSPPATSTTAP